MRSISAVKESALFLAQSLQARHLVRGQSRIAGPGRHSPEGVCWIEGLKYLRLKAAQVAKLLSLRIQDDSLSIQILFEHRAMLGFRTKFRSLALPTFTSSNMNSSSLEGRVCSS